MPDRAASKEYKKGEANSVGQLESNAMNEEAGMEGVRIAVFETGGIF